MSDPSAPQSHLDPDSVYGSPYGPPWSQLPGASASGANQPVPWTIGQTILGTLITVLPLLALDVVSQLGRSSTPARPLSRSTDIITAIFVFGLSALLEGALLIAPLLIAVIRRAPGYSALDGLRALGFRWVGFAPLGGWLIAGLAIALGANYLNTVLVQNLHLPLQTNGNLLANEVKYEPVTVLVTLVVAAVVAPICEEVFFRGFLEGGLLRYVSGIIAVFVSALVFGIAHGDVGSFAVLFVLGLVLGVARATSGSLWPGFVVHTANNTLAALAVLPMILTALQH